MVGRVALGLIVVPPAVAALRAGAAGRRARAALLTLVTVVVLVVAPLLLVASIAVPEGSLPPDDLEGRLPAGYGVVGHDVQCGSGGCWREYDVRGPAGTTADGAARALRDSGAEGCVRNSRLPDLRRRCTTVSVRGDLVRVEVGLTSGL